MDEPNGDQGTPGAPAPAPAGGEAGGSGSLSPQQLQDLLNAPEAPAPGAAPPADDFKDVPWDKVEAAWKAGKAPDNLKREVGRPFLQEFTRKSQALSQEKEAMMASLIEKLAARGVAPTAPEQDELREKLKEGGVPLELLDQYLDRKMAPIQNDISSQRMEALAIEAEPMVADKRGEIAEYIRSNPSVARLLLANKGRDGHEVIVSIARLMHYEQLKQESAAFKEKLPEMRVQIAKEIIAELKKTGQVLPSSTSRAGSGPTGESRQEFADFKSAAMAAAKAGNFPL